jgi:hypothetical protein
MPKNLRMKRKKYLNLPLGSQETYRGLCVAADEKQATGGSPFAPSRIPPVNQPKD